MGRKKEEKPEKPENVKDFQKTDKQMDKAGQRKKTGDPVLDELRKWGKDVDRD